MVLNKLERGGLSILVTVIVLSLFLLQATFASANHDGFPGSVDNGDGTHTLNYQPSGGANNGTDQGGPSLSPGLIPSVSHISRGKVS